MGLVDSQSWDCVVCVKAIIADFALAVCLGTEFPALSQEDGLWVRKGPSLVYTISVVTGHVLNFFLPSGVMHSYCFLLQITKLVPVLSLDLNLPLMPLWAS